METMHQTAADNEYLHKDFHGALSCAIDYLDEHFGEQAVRDYLRDFARRYYAPLREQVAKRGMDALQEHFEALYQLEGGTVHFENTGDRLVIRVDACPAVARMRARGYPVARLFHETTASVNAAICEGAGIRAELAEYDPETGRSVQAFIREEA